MTRGDIVIMSAPGDFTRKPRPYVIVQSDRSLADSATLTICPITTQTIDIGRVRITILATEETGLEFRSEIEVDRITTMRKSRVREMVGCAPASVMLAVDHALRRWLSL